MAEVLRPLVEASQRGDREALGALAGCVDRFVRIFSGSLSRRLRQGYGSTVDFVLEGLAEAMAKLPDFEYRSDEQFYAWVSSYIRGRILDAGRRTERRKGVERGIQLGDEIEALPTPDPTASATFSTREVRTVVGDAILSLQITDPLEMEVVVLKVFESKSWPQIRDQLDLTSEKRARTLFTRGISLLRPSLGRSLGKGAFQDLLGS